MKDKLFEHFVITTPAYVQEKPLRIVWSIQGSVRAVSRSHEVYRDDSLGVQKEVIVPRRGNKPGRPRTRYYLDEDPREFTSEEALIEALKSIAKGQNHG